MVDQRETVHDAAPAPAATRGTSRTTSAAATRAAARRPRWPWLIAVLTIGVFVVANIAYPRDEADASFTVMFASIIAAFVLVGALLASRVQHNPVGPIILAAGSLLATTVAIGTFGILAGGVPGIRSETLAIAALVNEVGFLVPIVVVLIGIPLVFPDGRLLSPRWRWVAALAASALAAFAVSFVLAPGTIGDTHVLNPFAVPSLAWLVDVLELYASAAAIAGFLAALAAVGIRYRRAQDLERHQLKWLIATALASATAFSTAIVIPSPFVAGVALGLGFVALLGLPLSIAVAILRYRLFEIDRIISRTIAWALISGVLLATFVVLVVALQSLLVEVTQAQTLAVAASTLTACVLFQPLRRTVQSVVDRRFDRARYDAQRTADAFAGRLRSRIDREAVTDELERTVEEAVRPIEVGVWLRRTR